MPTFSTPEPVAVVLDLGFADVHVVAGDRDDTVVEVLPRDPAKPGNVSAAEKTRVDFADGRLVIKSARAARKIRIRSEATEVHIALPAGSSLDGEADYGELHCTGSLGECRFKTAAGDIHVERSGHARLST